jgi:hypothetical protein
LAELANLQAPDLPAELVIEQIASFGMAVGAEVFETVFWTGRFYEAWPGASTRHRLPRSAVKMHLCQTMRAKDSNIRQALADRFGGSGAWGTKKAKGPLWGVTGHALAALAVAVTWHDQHAQASPSQGFGPLSAGSDALLR